jgi:hypothetical protein
MVRKMLDRRRQIDWQLVRGLIGLLFSTAIIAISVYHFASLAGVQAFVRAHFGDLLFQLFFVIFVITAAGFLFYLRQTRRGLYAFIEITFGLLAGVYAANQFYAADAQDSRVKAVFASVAGIYIIVRGLENWRQRDAIR